MSGIQSTNSKLIWEGIHPGTFVRTAQAGIVERLKERLASQGAWVKAFSIPVVEGVSRGCEAIPCLLYALGEQPICACTHRQTTLLSSVSMQQ